MLVIRANACALAFRRWIEADNMATMMRSNMEFGMDEARQKAEELFSAYVLAVAYERHRFHLAAVGRYAVAIH
jgi:hypothetical protein